MWHVQDRILAEMVWISPNITLFSGSIHNTAVCISISCILLFFWMKEITFNKLEQTWFLSTVFLCGEYLLWSTFLGKNFDSTFYLWELIFVDCWKKKKTKIANIKNCQSFVSHSSLPNFLSYGAPHMHVSHYSWAITQRPRHNDGWIANMLLCPYEIKSKLSLYYHPCRVNISQKDFKLICGVLCGPKLWWHELSLEEI